MSASKRKGTAFESLVRDHVNTAEVFGGKVERAPSWGASDQGDLVGTGAFAFECKAHRAIKLAEFLDEAVVAARNAGARFPVAVVKRRYKPVGDAYAVLRLDDLLALIGELPEELRQ